MIGDFRLTPGSLAAIRRYADGRRSAETIARLMNCAAGTIENICRDHGIELVAISDGAPAPKAYRTRDGRRYSCVTLEVAVADEPMETIRREAVRRGVKPATLVARLAEIVATEDLFSAVFDTK
jgi:hypothetical protein